MDEGFGVHGLFLRQDLQDDQDKKRSWPLAFPNPVNPVHPVIAWFLFLFNAVKCADFLGVKSDFPARFDRRSCEFADGVEEGFVGLVVAFDLTFHLS